jgi:hypothetical protein
MANAPELLTLAAVPLSVGTNVVHLSGVMNSRFDSVERRLEMIQGNTHQIDIRVTRLESKSWPGI